MDFLLVVFIFTIAPDGTMSEPLVATKPFWTLEECNAVGNNIRTVMAVPDEAKSLSYCVRKDEFDKELQP